MATKIVTKNSSTASAVPTASDLVQGELAVNVADKRLFTEDNAGAIVELGTNPSGLTVSGNIDVDGTITSSAGATITVADNSDVLTLVSTDADASVGPNLNLYRNSGSPADNDALGKIVFNGRNDNSQDVTYGLMEAYLLDASDGTEDGEITIRSMVGGTSTNRLDILPTETVFNQSSVDLDFRVESDGNANMLFVDGGANKVGIGTSSPSALLQLEGSDGTPQLKFLRTGTNIGGIIRQTSSPYGLTYDAIDGNAGAPTHVFRTSVDGSSFTERMRIDSSGNLLVGTTSTSPGVGNTAAGVAIRGGSDNRSFFSVSSNYVAAFNRNTNDGPIVEFNKDGTTVGSIQSRSGVVSTIVLDPRSGQGAGLTGAGAGGDTLRHITPTNELGAEVNGKVSLGKSNFVFKDLFLSGGVVFGTTGGSVSSKTLDDYEEGTFTASLRGGTSEPAPLITADVAKYTKVGDMVYIEISFENENTTGYSGTLSITGLPFTSGGGRSIMSPTHYLSATWADGSIPVAIVESTSSTISFENMDSGSAWAATQHNTAGSGRYLWVSGAYKV